MIFKLTNKLSINATTFINFLLVAITLSQTSTANGQNSFQIKPLKTTRPRYAAQKFSNKKIDLSLHQNKISVETSLLHSPKSSFTKKSVIANTEFSTSEHRISNNSRNLSPNLNLFAKRLQSAINEKLGIRYRYNGEDSSGYDCSGFVWSAFREAGILFNRSSAANYFNSFPKALPEEQSKFGTLIFFNGLGHVGIVKDENHFYHASLSNGIVLSKLDSYWQARLTGYRSIIRATTDLPSTPISRKLSMLEEQLQNKNN